MKVNIKINGIDIKANPDSNILEVALDNGINIPHLCYDKRMEAYGGCGLCVVEVEGINKLLRACATKISEGMVINTKTERTLASRKTAISMLMSDHRGDCRPPCMLACPAQTDCQGYVGLIANKQYDEALKLIKEQLPLPASIGRVCPHPCEDNCRRNYVDKPVAIADLKTFAAEIDLNKESYISDIKPSTGKKVAIVGAGPSGLTAAYFLAREGHKVIIYEGMPKAGGMLRYGIPEYRLPKEVLDKEIDIIESLGVEIIYNSRLGKDFQIDEIKEKYDAVYLAIGAWNASGLRCQGEEQPGVYGGIDFLINVAKGNPFKIGESVAVVGGGNTAMDVARTCVRLGAKKVHLLYRRTEDQMPAEKIEIHEAKEEGVIFNLLVSPIEIYGQDGKVKEIKCQKMKLGEKDKSGRQRPMPIEGDIEVYKVDNVISAIGQYVNTDNIEGLSLNKNGTIYVDASTFQTNIEKVFAGGDSVTGPGIAIEAIGQGKNAAKVISSYLEGNIKPYKEIKYVKQNDLTEEDFKDVEKIERVEEHVVDAEVRKNNFSPVKKVMSEEEAIKEANRCLECGCKDYFECQLLPLSIDLDIDPNKKYGAEHKRYEKGNHPFIERNPDKCIQCGLCVRVCEEIMGIGTLGLIDRGFDTLVAPEFGLPLSKTDCISCGQCIDVCPTGACMEKNPAVKEVPLELESTKSICSYCGVGCQLEYEHKGNVIYRALPDKESGEGALCAKGRFGIDYINSKDRLIKPMIANNKENSSWENALSSISDRLKTISDVNGENSIGILSTQILTNETYKKLNILSELLKTDKLGSMSIPKGFDKEYCGSKTNYNDIKIADLIISVGDTFKNHPIMGIKIKNASQNAQVISLNDKETKLNDWANELYSQQMGNFLKGILKMLVNDTHINLKYKNIKGFNELISALSNIEINEDMKLVTESILNGDNVVIIADENSLTPESIKLLSNIAYFMNESESNKGLIVLRKKVNSRGSLEYGFNKDGIGIMESIENEEIKGLIIIGEDILGAESKLKSYLNKLEYLVVLDFYETETSKLADVFLPLASLAESKGSITRSDGEIKNINSCFESKTGMTNEEIIETLISKIDNNYINENVTIVNQENDFELYIPSNNCNEYDNQVYDSVERQFNQFLEQNKISI